MPSPRMSIVGADAAITSGLAKLIESLGVDVSFPPEVMRETEAALAANVDDAAWLPPAERVEYGHLPFVTIDPPDSMDLDQALYLERDGSGYVVWYAIADVGAFVRPGSEFDKETHKRVLTLYGPDHRVPLHPMPLSEGGASLLPGQVRPAVVWRIRLDESGEGVEVDVRRGWVNSRAKLSYAGVQADLDAGTAQGCLPLLAEIGRLRQARAAARGGVDLPIPEQEVVRTDHGWQLNFRAPLPVEGWNAQISLLTGMAAAHLMVGAGVGIVRTLPPADPRDLRRLKQTAAALGVQWADDVNYPDMIRSLDPNVGAHAAVLSAATSTLRGANYASFTDGAPAERNHSALTQEYAHCTAPLRRLVDRYVSEVCLAIAASRPVPGWVIAELESLPATMMAGNRRSAAFERGCLDLVEAVLLTGREGDVFSATVVDIDERRPSGIVQLVEPAVRAKVEGANLPLGGPVEVRLKAASIDPVRVEFALA